MMTDRHFNAMVGFIVAGSFAVAGVILLRPDGDDRSSEACQAWGDAVEDLNAGVVDEVEGPRDQMRDAYEAAQADGDDELQTAFADVIVALRDIDHGGERSVSSGRLHEASETIDQAC
jgi:hypothetical protein